MSMEPEYDSIEEFVQFLLDDERTTFTHGDLQRLNAHLRRPTFEIRAALEGYGLTLAGRPKVKEVRGIQSWDENRWASNPCSGTSGQDNICGFAGRKG